MKKHYSRVLYLFLACEMIIFLLSLMIYREFSLLFYINFSFYIGGFFLFLSLLFFTVRSGFFDVMTKSFRMVFAGKDVSKKQIEEMPPLSQVISFDISLLFFNGLLITGGMLIALYIYSL